MPFLQLTLAVGAADPEPFEAALIELGASSITLEDAADDPVLEPAPGTTPLWPTIRLKALFDADADRSAVLGALGAQFGAALPQASFETIADRIWEREWLKDFRPMRFGRRLWVCPAGMRPDAANDAICIDLDPGLAFGTGTHPTTALCLDWLDGASPDGASPDGASPNGASPNGASPNGASLHGKTVIDYGCGSGVLAIAALKLGARSAIAIDIDPQAIIATIDNAQRNGVRDRLVAMTVAEARLAPADIVLANILAEPLERLAGALADLVAARGHIVLSGLLSSQAARLATLYAAWFDMEPAAVRDDWARLAGIKR